MTNKEKEVHNTCPVPVLFICRFYAVFAQNEPIPICSTGSYSKVIHASWHFSAWEVSLRSEVLITEDQCDFAFPTPVAPARWATYAPQWHPWPFQWRHQPCRAAPQKGMKLCNGDPVCMKIAKFCQLATVKQVSFGDRKAPELNFTTKK